VVEGGASNKGYLLNLIESERFRRAEVDTDGSTTSPPCARARPPTRFLRCAPLGARLSAPPRPRAPPAAAATRATSARRSVPASIGQRIDLSHRGESYRLHVYAIGAWRYRVHSTAWSRRRAAQRRPHRGTLVDGGDPPPAPRRQRPGAARRESTAIPYRFSTGARARCARARPRWWSRSRSRAATASRRARRSAGSKR
jgi:hypothetical protein